MLLTEVYANYMGAMMAIIPAFFAGITGADFVLGMQKLGAGMGIIGVLGAGIGQGNAGAGACMAIGRNPEVAGKITSTMIISAGIAESGAIYALVISILLMFVH